MNFHGKARIVNCSHRSTLNAQRSTLPKWRNMIHLMFILFVGVERWPLSDAFVFIMSRHYQKKPFHTNFEVSLTLPWRTCGRAFMAFISQRNWLSYSAQQCFTHGHLFTLHSCIVNSPFTMKLIRHLGYTALERCKFPLYNETNSASR